MEIKAQEDYKTVGKETKSASVAGQDVRLMDGPVKETVMLDKNVQEAEFFCTIPDSSKEEPKEVSRDQSELSKEVRYASGHREWDVIEAFKIWQAILDWMPGKDGDIEKEIRKLLEAYIQVLEALTDYTYGDGLVNGLEKLDQILIYKLEQLLNTDIPELKDFIVQYGPSDAFMRLRSSLFYNVTGKRLPVTMTKADWESSAAAGNQIVDHALNREGIKRESGYLTRKSVPAVMTSAYYKVAEPTGKTQAAKRNIDINHAARRAGELKPGGSGSERNSESSMPVRNGPVERKDNTVERFLDTGVYKIYARSGKTVEEPFYQRVYDNAKEDLERVRYVRKKGVVYQKPADRYYSVRDMKQAERFVHTFTRGGGNLYEKPQFTSDNPCLKGVLYTVMNGKVLLYISEERPGKAMCQDLKLSMEKMCSYMNDRQKRHVAYAEDYSHIYRCAVESMQSGMRVNKAVRSSVYYALKYFYDSQKKDETRADEQPQAFFTESKGKENVRRELENGLKVLEDDWKKYLKAMEYGGGENYILKLLPYSYWGIYEEPKGEEDEGPQTKEVQVKALWAMVFLIAAVIMFVVYIN